MTKIKVSKIDAARRQLDTAIKLWFKDDDPVVIHALVFAAFQVVQDLNEKKGDKSMTLLEMTRAVIKPEHVEEAMAILRKPMTFFKHANRDPHDILEFETETALSLIAMTIKGLSSLGEQRTDIQSIFLTWARLHKPTWFEDGEEFLENFGQDRIDALKIGTKEEFLELFLLNFAKKKGR